MAEDVSAFVCCIEWRCCERSSKVFVCVYVGVGVWRVRVMTVKSDVTPS